MTSNIEDPGLAEVLRRSCSMAAQPKEYHSTIKQLLFPPELVAACQEVDTTKNLQAFPRSVGAVDYRVEEREEMRAAARVIANLTSRSVGFKAPTGVGKSTQFPWELHNNTETVVVVLSPTEVIAQAHVAEMLELGYVATYVSAARMSITPLEKKMGVYYTTVDGMVMRALAAQKNMEDLEAPMLVVHDECHLRDSASYFLNMTWPDFISIKQMVHVSAVAVPCAEVSSGKTAHEAGGSKGAVMVSVPFCNETEVTLSDKLADGTYAPWAVENLRGKRTLMFVESDRIAQHMASSYGHFVETHIIRRTSDYACFCRARTSLCEFPTTGVLVIADSSLQGGAKLPVEQIIDFGSVRHTVAGAGLQPVDQYVAETKVERSLRANMSSGGDFGDVVAFVAEVPASDTVPGIGPGELERISALCGLFGYKSPKSTVPVEEPEKFAAADWCSFLASGLPWGLWANTQYKGREPVGIGTARGRVSDIDGLFDWSRGLLLSKPIERVSLPSGQFLSDAHGAVSANQAVIDPILEDYGELYSWLRERVKGPGVRRFGDLSVEEQGTVWIVWLTAWNWNVADLVALDRWRARHGAIMESWRAHAECRAKIVKLVTTARYIRDQWLLLREWYEILFDQHPYQLRPIAPDTDLIDVRYSGMVMVFGTGVVASHAGGSRAMGSGYSVLGTPGLYIARGPDEAAQGSRCARLLDRDWV